MRPPRAAVAALVVAGALAGGAAAMFDPKRVSRPDGSFSRSCGDIRTDGNRLFAKCRDLAGRVHAAELRDIRRCVGDIWNYEGKLYCSDSKPPNGQYLSYCKNPYTDGGVLYAACLKLTNLADGINARAAIEFARLPNFLRCGANIYWWNGHLGCDRPTSIDRVAYAKQCADRMGPVGVIDCTKGKPIPVTVKGVAETKNALPSCDTPAILRLESVVNASKSQCVPGSTFQQLPTNDPNVISVAQCRKYAPSDKPIFHDVAVIQHRVDTGETCFHQSYVQKWGKPGNPPGILGTAVPDPQTPDPPNEADRIWVHLAESNWDSIGLNTGYGMGSYNCMLCHDSNPFIWTPYLSKVALGIDEWNPKGKYNPFIGGMFGGGYTAIDPKDNKCTSCHRIGVRAWSRLRDSHLSITGRKFEHNMPPGDLAAGDPPGATVPHALMTTSEEVAAWTAKYGAAVAQIDKCLTATPEDPFPYLTHKDECRPLHFLSKPPK